jgi:hypothetical protein
MQRLEHVQLTPVVANTKFAGSKSAAVTLFVVGIYIKNELFLA